MSLISQVPSVAAAIREEAETRDAAFLEASADICGLTALPLTLRRYLLLCVSNNVFVTGGAITPEEAARFLWCVSDRYRADGTGLAEFLASVRQLNYGEVLEGISAYLAFAFFDAPADSDSKRDVATYQSFAAVYADILGREYGWSLRDVLDYPLPVIFQMLSRIQQRNDPKAILFNPLSDRARADYVRSLNAYV